MILSSHTFSDGILWNPIYLNDNLGMITSWLSHHLCDFAILVRNPLYNINWFVSPSTAASCATPFEEEE